MTTRTSLNSNDVMDLLVAAQYLEASEASKMLSQITEQQFQFAVKRAAMAYGWLVYHTYDSRRSDPGFPDLFMVRNGQAIAAELKREGKRGVVSAAQEDWLDAMSDVPGIRAYVWRPSQWQIILWQLNTAR